MISLYINLPQKAVPTICWLLSDTFHMVSNISGALNVHFTMLFHAIYILHNILYHLVHIIFFMYFKYCAPTETSTKILNDSHVPALIVQYRYGVKVLSMRSRLFSITPTPSILSPFYTVSLYWFRSDSIPH